MNAVKKSHFIRILLVIAILSLIGCFFIFDWHQYLSLEQLKSQREALFNYYNTHQLFVITLFFIAYVAITALSLPGAAIMTVAGGAIFGLFLGTILVSFASTIGATLAFLTARFLLRHSIQSRFPKQLARINEGIEKEGTLYLFSLRLVPLIPFFVINLVMGLTKISTWSFAWVSQLGMLAGTVIFVNAGVQLVNINSLKDILSPGLLLSFLLLAAFPWVAKFIINKVRKSS